MYSSINCLQSEFVFDIDFNSWKSSKMRAINSIPSENWCRTLVNQLMTSHSPSSWPAFVYWTIQTESKWQDKWRMQWPSERNSSNISDSIIDIMLEKLTDPNKCKLIWKKPFAVIANLLWWTCIENSRTRSFCISFSGSTGIWCSVLSMTRDWRRRRQQMQFQSKFNSNYLEAVNLKNGKYDKNKMEKLKKWNRNETYLLKAGVTIEAQNAGQHGNRQQ